jgi:hypothetical protein
MALLWATIEERRRLSGWSMGVLGLDSLNFFPERGMEHATQT